jgi:hypothetical protein
MWPDFSWKEKMRFHKRWAQDAINNIRFFSCFGEPRTLVGAVSPAQTLLGDRCDSGGTASQQRIQRWTQLIDCMSLIREKHSPQERGAGDDNKLAMSSAVPGGGLSASKVEHGHSSSCSPSAAASAGLEAQTCRVVRDTPAVAVAPCPSSRSSPHISPFQSLAERLGPRVRKTSLMVVDR